MPESKDIWGNDWGSVVSRKRQSNLLGGQTTAPSTPSVAPKRLSATLTEPVERKTWDAGKLETDFHQSFRDWSDNQTPETTGNLLKQLKPDIDDSIKKHLRQPSSPATRARARSIVMASLPRYDRHKAPLRSFIFTSLQGLKRVDAERTNPLGVPEAIRLTQQDLHDTRASLESELGREPSMGELANRAGLSIKRIHRVMSASVGMPESQLQQILSTDDDEGSAPGVLPAVQQSSIILRDMVYNDLNPTDQKVMEWSLGLYGSPQLGTNEIARNLGISAAAVSQRRSKIQQQLETVTDREGIL